MSTEQPKTEVNMTGFMDELKTGVQTGMNNAKSQSFEVLIENYILITGIFLAIVILLIIFFTSKTFRVGRRLDRMLIIEKFQEVKPFDYSRYGNVKLCDAKVNTSYNSAHSGYQMFDYTSEEMVRKKLQCGVRYFEFNIFNSQFGSKAIPVVTNGYKTGDWKLMLNDTPLEFCFDVLARNAFKVREGIHGSPNPEDPIFIALNLNPIIIWIVLI